LAGLLALYGGAAFLSLRMAYALRFDFDIPAVWSHHFQLTWPWAIPLKLAALAALGQFTGLLGYFSIPDFKRLCAAAVAPAACFLLMRLVFPQHYWIPRGVILMDALLSLGAVAAIRIGFRLREERRVGAGAKKSGRSRRVAIIGAGSAGASLARELFAKKGLGMQPVVFFDDDPGKWKLRVHDIPVVGAPEALLEHQLNLSLDEAIIAMPSASAKRKREIVKLLQKARLRFATVPSLDQFAAGGAKVSQLRTVEIHDLLGRDPAQLQTENIAEILKGRVALVTGAGGSIGSELCRQISSHAPEQLLLIDQSEGNLFQIEQELLEKGCGAWVIPLVADITDVDRMRSILEQFRPSVVFHAAARKHVPMMESHAAEAIKNNTLGAALMARLALEHQAERFVLISTDKAINPASVMGATKRLAEMFIQSMAAAHPGKTRFMAVRFGNVLGSSGSVVPIFKSQIAAGGPVKVTHPEVTRYFMTIPEAAGLVLQSASQGAGGEIFVLDMGAPIKIADLARQLIELSGFEAGEDIRIEFTGLRPGEKLAEELAGRAEIIAPTQHPKVLRLVSEALPLEQLAATLETLRIAARCEDNQRLKEELKKAVPEYQPCLI
jgi:FlaA1/EpsC-like NDP-sugar epimerase